MKTFHFLGYTEELPLGSGAQLVRKYFNPIYNEWEHYWIWDKHLILVRKKNQMEMPLSAVYPIFKGISNNLRPSEDTHRPWTWKATFESEKIGFSRGLCLGGDGVPGYEVFNSSRSSYINSICPQAHDFLDYVMLKDGILDFLLELRKEYHNK